MGARFSIHVKRIIILRFVIIPYTFIHSPGECKQTH